VALFDGGDHSTAELADLIGVTRSTVYRAVERERARVGMGLGAGMSAGWNLAAMSRRPPLRDSSLPLPPSPSRHRPPFRL
jgi:hypothetical protein